jgi:hypothetical protein
MCEKMALACALVLAAGTASAADKVVVDSSVVSNPSTTAQVRTLRQRVTNLQVNDSLFARVGECEEGDAWDNGNWDGRDGQVSHEGGAVPDGQKAADDFFLDRCQVWDLECISGCLITNSKFQLAGARLELYADCNGAPGELLYTFTEFEKERGASIGDGYYLITYTFCTADQEDDDYCDNIDNRNVVLHGGSYWVSVIGLTDGQGSDESFFATAGDPDGSGPEPSIIRQAVAHAILGVEDYGMWDEYSYDGQSWEPLTECDCIGCTDLCFEVVAHPCKIYLDNGGPGQGGSRSETSVLTSRNSRSADNVGTNPCKDEVVCYFEACVLTNCDCPFDVLLEVYENVCETPDFELGDEPFRGPYTATKVTLVRENAQRIENRDLNEYKAEWHNLSIELPRNANYWFAVSIQDGYNFNDRAYWCYNYTCADDCEIHISPSQILGPGFGYEEWTENSDDLSFLVAVEKDEAAGNTSVPTCAADFNRDNSVSVQDIYDFLTGWFAGCP